MTGGIILQPYHRNLQLFFGQFPVLKKKALIYTLLIHGGSILKYPAVINTHRERISLQDKRMVLRTLTVGVASIPSLRPTTAGSALGSRRRGGLAGCVELGAVGSGTTFFSIGCSLGWEAGRLIPAIPPTAGKGTELRCQGCQGSHRAYKRHNPGHDWIAWSTKLAPNAI